MYRAYAVLVLFASASAGCGEDGATTSDAPVTNGRCGAELALVGEVIDWGSTEATFCGVGFAKIQVRGDASRMQMTAPNGRLDLCLASEPTTELDLVPPTGPSQCASMPGSYTTPGIVIASKAVMQTGQSFSIRMFTTTQLQQQGLSLDPAKAHVFVHVAGPARAVSITSAHDPARAFDGAAWSTSDMGQSVFFPNIAVGSGTTTVEVPAPVTGPGSVLLVAGTVTYVMVVTR